MPEKILTIYTDGACKFNPGPGGWGAYLVYGEKTLEISGGEPMTTNNRMELKAVIEALKAIKRPVPIRMVLDSQYVKNGLEEWLANWKQNGWRTAAKKPVKNVDLWQELDSLMPRFEIEFVWVKGHAGNPGNEKADELANRGVPTVKR
ncbi:MAG TPA: ribonuclease HI [Sutterella sp.]|nr:ribonuclease HI [Sutterella sp.]